MSFLIKERKKKKNIYYTNEKEDKGQTPLSRRMKGKEFSKTLFQTMHEMKREIRGMRRERPEDPSKRISHEESPSSSYYVCENSATQSDLQRCRIPTFLAREEA